ncbi:hypothetical protein [Amycolatopsis sp. lyj-109]|uniref:PPE domain-containing protein n=1 Tax=Amycolatopsis sp. lyj-109 TaxID=2789287 RepID=UPI003978A77D
MNTGWHEDFRRRLLRPPAPAAAPAPAAGLELRPATGVPVTVWENVPHEQMMTEVTTNANPSAVAESAQEWLRIGEELQQHERALTRAIEESRTDWQGAGGDAARRHLTAVARWLGSTARGALLAGRQQQVHAQALEEVRRRMAANPPVAFSAETANARLQSITDPVEYARQLADDTRVRQAQEAAHAEAARIMTEFDRALAQAVVTPFFAAPPELPGVPVRSGLAPGADAAAGAPGRPVERLGAVSPVPAAGPGVETLVTSGVPAPGATGVGGVQPVPAGAGPGVEPLVASGVPVPGATGVGGVQPVPAAGVPPLPPEPPPPGSAEGTRPAAGVRGEVPPLPQPDTRAARSDAAGSGVPPFPQPDVAGRGGVSPFPQPGSTVPAGGSSVPRPDPAGRSGPPPFPQPDAAGKGGVPFPRPDAAGRGGVPSFPQPGSTVPSGASPFPQPGSPLPGVPPHPDSTAASGARFVPPIPPADPAVAGRIPPPLPPDPTSIGGTAGPRPLPPAAPTVSGAAGPGRVPSIAPGGVPSRAGGAGFGPGVRGGRRRDDAERSGGPWAPELSGAVPGETPAGAPGGPRPPAGQQGAQTPLTGLPRAGGKPAEDEEHRVADYLEADPELFAAEQPVVPPTLGDWKKNKNWKKKP